MDGNRASRRTAWHGMAWHRSPLPHPLNATAQTTAVCPLNTRWGAMEKPDGSPERSVATTSDWDATTSSQVPGAKASVRAWSDAKPETDFCRLAGA